MMRKSVLAAIAVGVLGVGAWRLAKSVTPDQAMTPLACQFAVGDELAFQLTSVAQSLNQGQAVRNELRARMWWKITAQQGSEWSAVAALSNVALSGDESEDRSAGLALPFQVRIGSDCRFRQIHFDPMSPPKVRVEIEGVLRAAEVILPSVPASEWVSRHRESSAEFEARYLRSRIESDTVLSRQKLRYAAHSLPALPDGSPLRLVVAESKAELVLDRQGRWLKEGQDHTRLRIERGSQLLSEIDTAVHLFRDTSAGAAPALLSQVDPSRLSASSSEKIKVHTETPLPPPPDPVLAQMELSAALADFAQRLSASADGLHHATLRLASYLSTHPQAIAELLQGIKSGSIDGKLHSALFLALERTGTKAAERGLASALQDRSMSTMNRMRAAAALQDIPRPSMQTAQTLAAQTKAGDEVLVTNSALLAMGALSRRAQKLEPQAADLIRGELRERLQSHTRPEELKVTLDAIGNSGDRELAPSLARYRHDASAETRAHAALAHRRMDVAVMEPALADWLSDEKESPVRRAIGQALADRLRETAQVPSAATIQVVSSQLAQETDPKARAALIAVLGLAAGSDDAAKRALVAQFHAETEVPLKVQIGRYVRAEDLAL